MIHRGEGVWVWDVEGNKLPRLPRRVLRGEPGPRPPADPPRAGRAGRAGDADLARVPQRPARPAVQGDHDLTGYQRMLPMNTGAEAVETAIKAARKWGYKVKGVPDGQAEILVFSRELPRAHDDDRRLLRRAAVPRRLRSVHARLHAAALRRPRRDRNGDRTRTSWPSWSSRSRARAASSLPPAGYLQGIAALVPRAPRAVHRRRDPVGPRAHRQAVRLPARGRAAGHRDRRQGARRRASTRSRRSWPTTR